MNAQGHIDRYKKLAQKRAVHLAYKLRLRMADENFWHRGCKNLTINDRWKKLLSPNKQRVIINGSAHTGWEGFYIGPADSYGGADVVLFDFDGRAHKETVWDTDVIFLDDMQFDMLAGDAC